MSAGANYKFHGQFGSFAEITAQVRPRTANPPEVGDTARFRSPDGTLGECSFGPSGWRVDRSVSPSGDTVIDGAVIAMASAPILPKFATGLSDVLAQVADCEINLVGDSWTYGYYGVLNQSMPIGYTIKSLLSPSLNPVMGWFPIGNISTNRDSDLWSVGAGWAAQGMGFGGVSALMATNPANPIVFTAPDICDSFDVMFVATSGLGTATIQATGGSIVSVPLNFAPAQTVVASCSAGQLKAGNTVTISGTGQIIFFAATGRNSTKKQTYINNLGVGGSFASGWAALSTGYASKDALGKTAPVLTIMQLGMNEALSNTASSTYITSLRNAIANNPVTGDLILASPGRANPATNSGTALARLKEYTSLVKSLANELGVRFIDVGEIVGDYSAAAYADSYHMKKSGYPKIALSYHRTMFL